MVDEDLYDDIFEEAYSRATPGLEEIEDEEVEYPDDVNVPYLHFIDGDELEEVIEDYCDQYDVPSHEEGQVKRNVVLGKSPSTSLDNVDRAREDAGLDPVSEMLEQDGGGRQ
ncbi:hypothetical protein [Haloarcula litorea]|uniref:hypothetical protein n=1 Tax=Haloarcula litorea TaxID=3032579 RepID=UPI0023E8440A|nr:hypothetical protein [Halomicroarcula sp. GDY20]